MLGNAHAQCTGDCDSNGAVAINELVTCVNVGLDLLPLGQCMACDGSGDSRVAINEMITSVNIALGLQPCGGEPGTPTIGPGATPTATPSGNLITQCCVPAYYIWECEDRTVDECAALGGVDRGPAACSAALCADLPPSDGHGICCLPNAAGDEIECEDRTASLCLDSGGVVKPTGSVCTPETCADVIPPNPDVMCCLPNPAGDEVECEDRTASVCAAEGGVNKGPGVCALDSCADVTPPNPDVMCCLLNPGGDEIECEDRTASACAAAGGQNKGPGVCAPNSCAEVSPLDIQCCVPKHSGEVIECEDLTPEACAAQGGVNMGAGTCSPDPCNP